jgi:hypothetical protein
VESSGNFTVKSAYRMLMRDFVRPGEDCKEIIWHVISPLKIVLFVRKIIQNRLPTKDSLVKMVINMIASSCEPSSNILILCCLSVLVLVRRFSRFIDLLIW